MNLEIRRLYSILEETRVEGGVPVPNAPQIGVSAAVVKNPFAGQFVKDLVPLNRAGVELGRVLAKRMVDLLGGPSRVMAYSKCVLVGVQGELEHGSALIHTRAFGDEIRSAAAGEADVVSTEKRGVTGSPIDLPLKAKMPSNIRPYHQTFTLQIADAPFADEIIVIVAGATGGRPHSRLIERKDEKELLDLK